MLKCQRPTDIRGLPFESRLRKSREISTLLEDKLIKILETLISGPCDIIISWKIELASFAQINTDNIVVLSDPMGFSQDVQMDLAIWVNIRNEWKSRRADVIMQNTGRATKRNECHHLYNIKIIIIVLNYTHIKSNTVAIVILHCLLPFKLNLIDE